MAWIRAYGSVNLVIMCFYAYIIESLTLVWGVRVTCNDSKRRSLQHINSIGVVPVRVCVCCLKAEVPKI